MVSIGSPLRRTEPAGRSRPCRVTIACASAPRAVMSLQPLKFGIPARGSYYVLMDLDKVDEAVLALLYLGIHERHRTIAGARTWKSFDWAAMGRLHRNGLITDPVTKAKSVLLTEAGLAEAEAAFRRLFDAEDDAEL